MVMLEQPTAFNVALRAWLEPRFGDSPL
jgi:hypothetical protein